jgi:hypothetical protein
MIALTQFATIHLDLDSWNEAGGLLGLIFAALFVLIGTFQWHIKAQDREHAETVKDLLKDEREDRRLTRLETNASYDKLSEVIYKLGKSLNNIEKNN